VRAACGVLDWSWASERSKTTCRCDTARNISKRSNVRKEPLLAEGGAGKTALPPSLAQEDAMKNVYDVLRQKEQQLVTMQKEVDALRIVAPLLEDEVKTPAPISQQLHQANAKKGVLP
jgi:hypothetical protein